MTPCFAQITMRCLRRLRHCLTLIQANLGVERNETNPFGQIDNGLWLPAQKMGIQILLILITRNMTQISQMYGLGMNDRMEIRASSST